MIDVIQKKFIHGGNVVDDGPQWGMTKLSSGSMRFRWNETNEVRDSFLAELSGPSKKTAAVELIHSKIIYDIDFPQQTELKQGDGILTRNKDVVPVVTVADCMPLFIYDLSSGTFGALHSGWRGTGIVGEAVSMIREKYGSKPQDICVAIGPHIGDCCYNITKERAEYFCDNFGSACVNKIDDDNWALSLTKANLDVLEKCGVPADNITVMDECTCCRKENGVFKFGSFRRQTMGLPDGIPLEERLKKFTVQAAFTIWK